MTTLNDIVNDVLTELHGQTSDLESVTFLTAPITTTDTTLRVDDASQISTGLIEIDDELLWVVGTDEDNNVVTVAPFGRGQRGSTAAAHTANVMVTDNPRFPRSSVVTRVNQALNEIYPEAYAVKSDESNVANPVQTSYGVPAQCDNILALRWKTIGPSQLWQPIRRYSLNPKADTAVFPTGRSVDIGDPMVPGATIQIVFAAAPGKFNVGTDTLDATVGLDDNFRDVIMYGACYRLVAGLEIARLQNSTVEQGYDKTTYVGTTGAATAGSKFYLQVFQSRLADERARLQRLFPTTTHLER